MYLDFDWNFIDKQSKKLNLNPDYYKPPLECGKKREKYIHKPYVFMSSSLKQPDCRESCSIWQHLTSHEYYLKATEMRRAQQLKLTTISNSHYGWKEL